MNPKIIAFYLPQYYPFKENDEWWGKGFTEWYNVGKARPLWKGHHQPRVPTELGYYDLRMPEVREQQAELARQAGITAFCYWHYWFGNGKRLLERVFNEVLESGYPNFPFCLGWANHSWYAKRWNKDTNQDRLLIEQTYPVGDDLLHFEFLLKAFKDKRYFKVNGCPFLLIYQPDDLPTDYLLNLKRWTKEAGFPGLYTVANCFDKKKDKSHYLNKGYESVHYNRLGNVLYDEYAEYGKIHELFDRIKRLSIQTFNGRPRGAVNYQDYYKRFVEPIDKDINVIPQIVPQWDHSPRSGNKAAMIFYNSTPDNFKKQIRMAFDTIKDKPEEQQIVILKSWNEWGEGNYMEPDNYYGRGFIDALHDIVEEYKNK